MAEAYRCDRCGAFHEDKTPEAKLTLPELKLSAFDSEDSFDTYPTGLLRKKKQGNKLLLCHVCTFSFKKWLETPEPRNRANED